MFEPNLRNERYLPFEGAGVVSKWDIELLGKPSQFDYDTIADVVLFFRFTARPGAPAATVFPAVDAWLKENSARLFSMRHEFPSEWASFKRIQLAPGQKAALAFELKDEHFPYRMQGVSSNARQLHLFARTEAQQATAELIRETKPVGMTNLANGEAVMVPQPQSGAPRMFEPHGNFELRFDTTAFEDLWVVVDWTPAEA
jgi:hypothetical protein